jgi:hypothetical protein
MRILDRGCDHVKPWNTSRDIEKQVERLMPALIVAAVH